MTRRALLVGCSQTAGETPLPGAHSDMTGLSRYLVSISGGAWEDSEVWAMSNPSRQDVLRGKAWAETADYSFVAFSGHGYEQQMRYPGGQLFTMTTMVCSDGEDVLRSELTPRSGRSLVLLDCCRVVQPITEKGASVDGAFAEGDLRIDRRTARFLFDRAVAESFLGPEFVYGCQFDGTASDTPSFTSALLAIGSQWGEQRSGVLNLASSFVAAKNLHDRISPGRNPQLELGRGIANRTVPFSVGNLGS